MTGSPRGAKKARYLWSAAGAFDSRFNIRDGLRLSGRFALPQKEVPT